MNPKDEDIFSPRITNQANEKLLSPTLKKINSAGEVFELPLSPALNKYHSCDANYMKETGQYKRIWIMNKMTDMNLNLNVASQIIDQFFNDKKDKELIAQEMIEFMINNSEILNFPLEHVSNALPSENRLITSILKKLSSSNIDARNENQHLVLNRIESNHLVLQIDGMTPRAEDLLRMCEICSLSYIDDSTNFLETTRECHHSFCKGCCKAYLETLINSSQIKSVPCPDEKCGIKLSNSDIERMCQDSNLFNKFKKFKISLEVNLDQNARWCIYPGCENILRVNQSSAKLVCDKCNTAMCSKCLSKWHDKQTCEEAIEGGYSEYTKNVQVRNCKKCRSRIEKNGGCNHMTCFKCGYQFCWLCNGKYGSKHYQWYNIFGCPLSQYNKASKYEITKTFLKKIFKNFFVLLFYIICFGIGIPIMISLVLLIGMVCYLILPINKAKNIKDWGIENPVGKLLAWLVFTIFWYALMPLFILPYSFFAFIRLIDRRTPFSLKRRYL